MRIRYGLRYLILLLLGLQALRGQAQNQVQVDSLIKAYQQEKEESRKLQNCLKLVNEVADYDSLATVRYGKEGLALASKLKDKRTSALLNLQIGVMYTYHGNEESALNYYRAALREAQLAGDPLISADVYNSLSNLYQATGNYKLRDENLQKALKIYEKQGARKEISMIYANMGANFNRTGDFVQAVKYLLKSLKIREELHYDQGIASVAFNITHAYMMLKQYREAIQYNELATEKYRLLKNEGMLGNCYTVKATVLRRMGNAADAIVYYNRALPLLYKYENTQGLRSAYDGLGILALEHRDFTEATGYFTKSRKISLADKQWQGIVSSDINLAQVGLDTKSYATALNYIREAEPLAVRYNLKSELAEIYKLKLQYYTATHQVEAANHTFEVYEKLRDSLAGEEVSLKVADIRTRYETEKKDSQIALLQKQSRIQQLQLDNRSLQVKQRNLVIGFIVALLVGVLLFIRSRNKRLRQETAAQLQEAAFKQKEVAARALFEGEQKERIRLARDLHDSIGQMLAVVRMNISGLHDEQPERENLKNTLKLVDDTIHEVRNISHNLIPEELNFGLFSALDELCRKINEANNTRVSLIVPEAAGNYNFEKANELSIYRIVQEVLSNMIRHAGATLIEIAVKQEPELMVIHIKDNGRGFDTSAINESKGIGWKNIAARVNMLDGQLQVYSEQLVGTRIEIAIPKG